MKRTFFIAAIALCSLSIASAQERVDSLVVENPRRVVIVSDETSQSVSIKGSADDPGYTYYRKVEVGSSANVHESEMPGMLDFNIPFVNRPKTDRARFEAGLFDVYGGFMVDAQPNPYDFGYWNSGEWGFSVLRYRSRPLGQNFHITSAVGFGFKDFESRENVMYHKVDGGISVVPVPENMSLDRSKVKLASVNIPLMLSFYSKRDRFGIAVGPVANFNFHSKIKNVYTMGGGSVQKDKEKNIHARPVTLDYMAMVRFSDLGLYVKWSPHGIFDSAYSPDIQTVTVGTVLNCNW